MGVAVQVIGSDHNTDIVQRQRRQDLVIGWTRSVTSTLDLPSPLFTHFGSHLIFLIYFPSITGAMEELEDKRCVELSSLFSGTDGNPMSETMTFKQSGTENISDSWLKGQHWPAR